MKQCCDHLISALNQLNQCKECEVLGNINAALDNFVANVKYRFVDDFGSRLEKVSKDNPLMHE